MNYADKPLTSLFIQNNEELDLQGGLVKEPTLDSVQTPVVDRIRKGLPFRDFANLQALLEIPEEHLGAYLGMSNATLHRRKKAGKFSQGEGERLVRFTRLFGLARSVFETDAGARSWLKAENPGTAGETPLSYADTEFGAREVENLLGRIDHGIF